MGCREFALACKFASGKSATEQLVWILIINDVADGFDALDCLLTVLNVQLCARHRRGGRIKAYVQLLSIVELQLVAEDVLATLDILLESYTSASFPTTEDNASSVWSGRLNFLSAEQCKVLERLNAMLSDGNLATEGAKGYVAVEDLSRAPVSKSSRDSDIGIADGTTSEDSSPGRKQRTSHSKVSQMVSHFSKLQEQSSPQKVSPVRRTSKLIDESLYGLDGKIQLRDPNVPLHDRETIQQSELKTVALKPELKHTLIGVRFCMKRSEACWISIADSLRGNRKRLYNNLR
jgi:hypothetical protein